jgi:hypothetical protein
MFHTSLLEVYQPREEVHFFLHMDPPIYITFFIMLQLHFTLAIIVTFNYFSFQHKITII